jgi:hypothetical protein
LKRTVNSGSPGNAILVAAVDFEMGVVVEQVAATQVGYSQAAGPVYKAAVDVSRTYLLLWVEVQ